MIAYIRVCDTTPGQHYQIIKAVKTVEPLWNCYALTLGDFINIKLLKFNNYTEFDPSYPGRKYWIVRGLEHFLPAELII